MAAFPFTWISQIQLAIRANVQDKCPARVGRIYYIFQPPIGPKMMARQEQSEIGRRLNELLNAYEYKTSSRTSTPGTVRSSKHSSERYRGRERLL
jgi:hypothetical protein